MTIALIIEVRLSESASIFTELKIDEVISYPFLGNQGKSQEKQGSVTPCDGGGAEKKGKQSLD